MFFEPLWNFLKRSRRLETDVTTAAVKGESVLRKYFENLPCFNVRFTRRLEVKAHVGHRFRAIGAYDFAWDVLKTLLRSECGFVALLPLPVLERLAAIEAGEVISVVVPCIAAHGRHPHV